MKFMYGRCKANADLSLVVLFAQFIDEMLYDYTPDTYKAYALNVHSSLLELQIMVNDYRDGRIKYGTLSGIIEELEYKLNNDEVISGEYKKYYQKHILNIKNSKDGDTIKYYIESFISEINFHYWNDLKVEILKCLQGNKEKKKLRELVNTFICENEIRGHSREYIYTMNRRFFFDRRFYPSRINNISDVNEFLAYFDDIEKEYIVINRGSSSCNLLLSLSDIFSNTYSISITNENPFEKRKTLRANTFLGESKDYPIYIQTKVKSKDWITAKLLVDRIMSTLVDIYHFHDSSQNIDWNETSLVIYDGQDYLIRPQTRAIMKGGITNIIEFLPKTLSLVNGNSLDNKSKLTLIKTLSFHRAAFEARRPENELLDLWAAMESFIPAHDESRDRIVHYSDYLIPYLTITYSHKLFSYLYNLIKDNKEVLSIINEHGDGDNILLNLVKIITCEDMKLARMSLYSKVSSNPLLLFRFWSLHEQFKSSSHIHNTIENHRRRVNSPPPERRRHQVPD